VSAPALSVVVVTRERERRLAALLDSLRAQQLDGPDLEVVVVDDASSDGTQELLRRMAVSPGLALHVVARDDRPGLGALRNAGWRAAGADLVAFVDDDCVAEAAWAAALLAAAAAHPGAAIQGRTTPIPAELDRLHPLAYTKWIEAAGPWYETCNIAYPRALLERLGGFDESLRVVGEDTDLGWRAREAGAAIAYEPTAHVRHAVYRLPLRGWLELARRERYAGQVFARHPGLRAEAGMLGVLKRHRAPIALALAGLVAARRRRAASALALPYAVDLGRRCAGARAGPQWAAWFAAYDAVCTAYAVGGAVKSRVPFV
jgi:GT2 family glycosyltransferase